MPRPFPWLPRLSAIRRTVANSVRSHFSRRELEVLLGVSERAAGRLLKLLATERIGTAHMVSREGLAGFLAQLAEADDVPALCERIRAERENLTRVKARYLHARDDVEVPVTSLPASIRIEPGLLTVQSATLEHLVAQLVLLGQAMRDDPLAFEAMFEPAHTLPLSAEAEDARTIQAEIERMRNAQMPPAEAGGMQV